MGTDAQCIVGMLVMVLAGVTIFKWLAGIEDEQY